MCVPEYISTFSRLGKKLDNLDRIASLLDAAENPQKNLKFIHIAGTNGKGSMAQMFSDILIAGGYKTGLFTSPFIIKFNDRIRLNNENISNAELDSIMNELKPAVDSHPLRNEFSQFEITQAIAFTYFKKHKCDAVVLETGLGGLLDSTNVIKKPLVSVIGSVAFDHMAILGNTLENIAKQKAGIIKDDCPCVLSDGNEPEVVAVVKKAAENHHSKLVIPDSADCWILKSDIKGNEFLYDGVHYKTAMAGAKQIDNALTVIEAMKIVKETLPVNDRQIALGISRARLPGRIEVIGENPLTILDGAHNPDGMKALADVLSKLDGEKITAVIGMHRDKNAFDAVSKLIPFVSNFVTVSGYSDRDYPSSDLAEIINSAGGNATIGTDDIAIEIAKARNKNKNGAVLICGSLYLVSWVKTHCNFDI